MMLGMAASSSMAMPIGPFRKFGAISVTNIAMPRAVGMAKSKARAVVTNVPYIVVAAPKTPVTGFQAVEVRKSISPNFPIASEDSLTSTMMMPMIKKMTVKDAIAVRERKISSGIFFCGDMANERTFPIYRTMNKKTGQVPTLYIPDPLISTTFLLWCFNS